MLTVTPRVVLSALVPEDLNYGPVTAKKHMNRACQRSLGHTLDLHRLKQILITWAHSRSSQIKANTHHLGTL